MKYKLLILVLVALIFIGGCAWLSEGVLNVFDPKAQVRVTGFDVVPPEGEEISPTLTINLVCLNQVGARFGTFYYQYSKKIGGISTQLIPELTTTYGVNVLLPPGEEGGGVTATIDKVPLYFQKQIDYMNIHLDTSELLLTLWLKGIDEADHEIEVNILKDYPIAVSPPKVEAINISANPSVLSPGEESTITVQALSKNGKPVNGAIITLTAAGGTLGATSLITDATGTASTTFTAGNTPGEATITATCDEATASATIVIKAPQPGTITVTASPSTVTAGAPSIITVVVTDAQGNPVEGVSITLAASGGTLASTTLTTDATGAASTTLDTTGVAAGTTITVTAVAGGATGVTTVNVQ